MRGVCRSEPKFLAIFTNLNARRSSVRTEIPGDIYPFEREVFFSQNSNSWQQLPVRTRGVILSEPESLAIFPSLNERRFSADAEIPGGIYQFGRESFFGQNRNAWQFLPMRMRDVFQSGPKFLATVTNMNATSFSARTKILGDVPQSSREASVCQNQNSQQYVPVLMRGGFRSGPKSPCGISQF